MLPYKEVENIVNEDGLKDVSDLFEVIPSFNPSVDSDLNELIDSGWQNLCDKWQKNNQNYFNAGLYNFEGIKQYGRQKIIQVSQSVDYKTITGIRYWLNHPIYTEEIKQKAMARVKTMSIIAIIKNPYGNVLWRVRCSGDWPKSLELPGGFIRSRELSIKDSILNRIKEDLDEDFSHIPYKLIAFEHYKNILECMLHVEFQIDLDLEQKIKNKSNINQVVFLSSVEFQNYIQNTPLHVPSQVVYSRNL